MKNVTVKGGIKILDIIPDLINQPGVKLTPAGSAYPGGNDPQDRNIRLAPTFPGLEDVEACVSAFCVCVKLATARAAASAAKRGD